MKYKVKEEAAQYVINKKGKPKASFIKGGIAMRVIQATVPDELVREMEGLTRSGVFKDNSEVINVALKKMLAEQSREYLREIVRKAGIKKSEMLAEGKRVRR